LTKEQAVVIPAIISRSLPGFPYMFLSVKKALKDLLMSAWKVHGMKHAPKRSKKASRLIHFE
jgi:hypothetical protein